MINSEKNNINDNQDKNTEIIHSEEKNKAKLF